MPTLRLYRSFLALYMTVGVVVLVQSVATVLDARSGNIAPADRLHAVILGTMEAVAALLFLWPRTMRFGAATLLAVFAGAFALHASHGDVHWALLVYGAAVWFVRTHGADRPAALEVP